MLIAEALADEERNRGAALEHHHRLHWPSARSAPCDRTFCIVQ